MVEYFISHSCKDSDIVKKFINMLVLGASVPNDETFFCTSRAGDDITSGKDFVDEISAKLKESKTVFAFFSHNYLDSTVCMAELGASWILNKNIITIIIDDSALFKTSLKFDDTTALCRNLQGNPIDKVGLNKILDDVIKKDYPNCNTNKWEESRDEFLAEYEKLKTKRREPNKVLFSEYCEYLEELECVKKENEELKAEVQKQKKLVEQLSKVENKNERNDILFQNSDEIEQFQILCSELSEELNSFPKIIRYLCFKEIRGEPVLWQDLKARYSEEDITDVVNEDYIDAETFELNHNNRKFRRLFEKIEQMQKYLLNVPEAVFDYAEEKLDIDLDLKSKDFWEKCLEVKF